MESVKVPQNNQKSPDHEDPSEEVQLEDGRNTTKGWPNWAVAVGLLALVLLILGGAFFLNSRLKPRVGTESVASDATSISGLTQPGSRASVGSSPEKASTTHPSAVGQASTTGTDDSSEAISQAYLHYWDVYNGALLTVDASHLSEVSAGDELTRDTQSVQQLQSAHEALHSDITHHLQVTSVSADSATVHDQFEDRSYLIDPTTKESVGTPQPASTETIACQLSRINGVWKVVNVVKVAVTVVHQ